MKTALALVAVVSTALLVPGPFLAQDAPAKTVRWAEGAPNSLLDVKKDLKTEGLRGDKVHVFVNLAELKETHYNRVWVQVFNRSQSQVDFDPQTAILTGEGTELTALVPDKAAMAIFSDGKAKADDLATCGPLGPGCSARLQAADEVRTTAAVQAQWVHDYGLAPKTLAPGHEVKGAIVFRKGKKPTDYIFRLRVGDEVFEFPLSAQNKAPASLD